MVTYAVTAKIKFYNENASTTALRMLVRPQGSSGPYTQVTASQLYNYSGSAISGWFSYDLSQPPFSNQASTSWDIKYVAADATGNLYDAKQGTLTIDGSLNNVASARVRYYYGFDSNFLSKVDALPWPYLPTGIERDTTWAQQGTTGRLAKNGAVLTREPGRTA